MVRLILRIYDYLSGRRWLTYAILVATVMVLNILLLRVHYQEDISAFLPLDSRGQKSARVYQTLSGSDRIVALVSIRDTTAADPDRVSAAAVRLGGELRRSGIADSSMTVTADMSRMAALTQFVTYNIPYFLTSADYARMERQLADPQFLEKSLAHDRELLLLPSGGVASAAIGSDPLGLFTPVLSRLSSQHSDARYELYDGCIMTPDMRCAIVTVTSPYGSSETEHNRVLVDSISSAARRVEHSLPSVGIRLTGGPVIAVGNAAQIKSDSLLSVSVAGVLILILLIAAFRSARNIILVFVSVSWGWLFALGALSLIHNGVSVIVIGISSVIIGLAVNYPLHLISHLSHTPDVRRALLELLMPLLIGNITTIGAFLTLVPLRAAALRDLGLFASLLLLGTILFTLVFLPHMIRAGRAAPSVHGDDSVPAGTAPLRMWPVAVVGIVTVALAVFSTRTSFDTDMSHINYMSDEEKADVAYLMRQGLGGMRADSVRDVYVVSSGRTVDAALAANEAVLDSLSSFAGGRLSSPSSFLASRAEQRRRLAAWQQFVDRHRAQLTSGLRAAAQSAGFAPDAFSAFYELTERRYAVREPAYFSPLLTAMPNSIGYVSADSTFNVVNVLSVPARQLSAVMDGLHSRVDDACHFHFEIGRLNSSMAETLSDNFNYIGVACGFIVFFFLWLSMGSIELAALSFLPMAVSWVWILGIMGLAGINFNIVNIILATFIFGQGDDYTIFITEGCQYEYAYGRRMLRSYKRSILLSALIMFVGIGALILARHPALRSLAEVTIVGMFSVVLMAWLLPPFVFRLLVSRRDGTLRRRPVTLRRLLRGSCSDKCLPGRSDSYYERYVRDVYYYCGTDIVRTVKASLAGRDPSVSVSSSGAITVGGGSYGAVALFEALKHPDAVVTARVINADDEAVCRRIAMRVAPNIVVAE